MTGKLKICFSVFAAVVFIAVLNSCSHSSRNKSGTSSTPKKDSATIMAMGKEVFSATCSACHGNPAFPKATAQEAMAAMAPRVILNALDNGKMRNRQSNFLKNIGEQYRNILPTKCLRR